MSGTSETTQKLQSSLEAIGQTISAIIKYREDKQRAGSLSDPTWRSDADQADPIALDPTLESCKQVVEDLQRAEASIAKLRHELREQQAVAMPSPFLHRLCTLPFDIFGFICDELDARDMGSLRKTCKTLENLTAPFALTNVALRRVDMPSELLLDLIYHFFARPIAANTKTLKITDKCSGGYLSDGRHVRISDLILGSLSAEEAYQAAAPQLAKLQGLFLEGNSARKNYSDDEYALWDDWAIGNYLCRDLLHLRELTLKNMRLDLDGMGVFPIPSTLKRLSLIDISCEIPGFDSLFEYQRAHGESYAVERVFPEMQLEYLLLNNCNIIGMGEYSRLFRPVGRIRSLRRVEMISPWGLTEEAEITMAMSMHFGDNIVRTSGWRIGHDGQSYEEFTWTWKADGQ